MNTTPSNQRWGVRCWAPALLLSAALLSGCGPRSLSAHIPHPHFFFFQNTKPLQSAPAAVLLPADQLPGKFKSVTSSAELNATVGSGTAAAEAAASGAKWHRVDGAIASYALATDPAAPTFALPTRVQINVGRYATDSDAKGWFEDVAVQPPALGQVNRLPDPKITPRDVLYESQLPGVTIRVLFFQQRNVVVRVLVFAPSGSSVLGATGTIAQREAARIESAK